MALSHPKLDELERRMWRFVRGEDADRTDGTSRTAPEWLVLGINNFCNLHCKMCDVGLGETETAFYANLIGKSPRNMSRELFELVVEQARRFRPPPRIGLAYTEPLLHTGVVEFCRGISRRGLYGSVTTNGYLLPRLAEGLVASGLDWITVSVDGPRAVHDRVRRSTDSFDRIYEGVERLNRARLRSKKDAPRVQFSYTITDENYTDMLRFAREVEPLEPSSLTFTHLNFITAEMAESHNAAVANRELRVTRSNLGDMRLERMDLDALWRALGELKDYVRASRNFRFSLVPDFRDRGRLEAFYRAPATFIGGRRCTDPWRMMMIQADGTVIPAHGRCYHFPVGRIGEMTLAEIWNGSRFRELRRTLRQSGGTLPACSRCCGVIGKPDP